MNVEEVLILGKGGRKVAKWVVDALEHTGGQPPLFTVCSGGARGGRIQTDLCLLMPGAQGKRDIPPVSCRALLMPAEMEIQNIDADYAVSYGMNGKDTVTVSSIDEEECVVALQRELVTLCGAVLERQEIPIRNTQGLEKEELLAAVGAALILKRHEEK